MQTPHIFHPTRSKYLVFTADYLLPLAIFLGILALGCFVLFSPFFKISIVTCFVDYTPCTDGSILAELDKLKGQNIFTLIPSKVESRLTSGDFTIREAKLTRTLPGTLKLNLESVYPVVALQIADDPTWVVMDSRFRVITTRTEDPNVPTVIVRTPLTLSVGKPPADSVIIQTLELALRLASELFTVKTITLVDKDTIKLSLVDGRIAIFTPQKDEIVQLSALQTILANDTISQGVSTIDVRFSRPVLR